MEKTMIPTLIFAHAQMLEETVFQKLTCYQYYSNSFVKTGTDMSKQRQ